MPAPLVPGPGRGASWRPRSLVSSRPESTSAGSASYWQPRPQIGSPGRTGGSEEERATVALTHPEDEVKSEEQVFDAFGASFDRHGAG